MREIDFIVDAGVGKIIENWLLSEGYSIYSVISLNPEISDSEIISLASESNSVIITMDKDFGELVYNRNFVHKGILLLRLEDAVAEEKLASIQNIIPEHIDKLKNKFSVYQNGKLRQGK